MVREKESLRENSLSLGEERNRQRLDFIAIEDILINTSGGQHPPTPTNSSFKPLPKYVAEEF